MIGLAIAAVVALYAIILYNGLVKARQVKEEAWSGIDVQLKRRADLIPNLVETVKGYATHERETFEQVVELRNRAQAVPAGDVQGRAVAEGLLGQALGKLVALAEAYPDLKASQNFSELQASLQEVEDELQMARRYYNGAARDLNVKVESFPSSLLASAFSFAKAPYFEIENPADRAVPTVKF
ncbi:LemA family protein (plasmid) [Rhizobium sp. TRM96647]|uniref:LemA family protein n=1 Tax=unclassified Rhizobium TaxID=2613769 RepID=UPI001E6094D3|nr:MULTISPECIES: LemA family protein [unclassified Rhizobium]MCD2180710.1 LemA family protein [Rhizobium sp. GN54]MCV3735445.1 LemA family protein [Rhizobium sp. TRM96647]MCV3757792.1 LemA family protein [Rhizobium sp. TRM96650]